MSQTDKTFRARGCAFLKSSASMLTLASALPAMLVATPAFAASGDVVSAVPQTGAGNCRILINFDIAGTDQDESFGGGQFIDNYRLKMVAPNTTTAIGTNITQGVFQDFTTQRLTRTLELTANDIVGTPLAGAGPNATLNVALEDVTGTQNAPVDGPFEDVFPVTVQSLRAGNARCNQVANAISPNMAPTAAANVNPTAAQVPEVQPAGYTSPAITLDASGSTDPDGNTLSYTWRQTAGTPTSLTSTTSATPSIDLASATYAADETLTYEVTVSDGSLSDTETVDFFVLLNEQPIAMTGSNRTVNTRPGQNFQVSASNSSDPEGAALTYEWVQTSGPAVNDSSGNPTTLGNVLGTQVALTVQPPTGLNTNQVVVFEVRVSDGTNAPATDTVTLTLQPAPNTAPVADAGPDQTVARRDFVRLDASASSDPDNDPLTYNWNQTGGTAVGLSSMIDANPTFNAPNVDRRGEDLTFEVTATDPDGASSVDTVVISIPANSAPTPNAGPDQTAQGGSTVTLDGTGSTDPEGDALAYSWVQSSGPVVTLNGDTTANPTFVAPAAISSPQTLVFSLVVEDGIPNPPNSVVGLDSVTITIPAVSANATPVAEAGQDIVDTAYQSGTNIRLDASASTDADGDPLSYAWRQVSGPQAFLGGAGTVSPTVSLNTAGLSGVQTLVFEVTVSDGMASDTDRVTLELTPASGTNSTLQSTMPVITGFVNAGFNDECQVTASFSVTGATNDDNGDDLYQVRLTDGNDGNRLDSGQSGFVEVGTTKTDSLYARLRSTTVASATASGQLFFNVFDVLVDSSGNTSIGQRVARTRVDLADMAAAGGICGQLANQIQGTNGTPFADAGPDQSFQNVRTAQTVTLDGTGSTDPENDALTYQWTQVAGTSVSLSNATSANPTFSFQPTQAETLVFELVVSDGNTISSADRVSIAFAPFVNSGPTADASADQTLIVPPNGQTVQLDGSGSSDPDNDPITYSWVQVSGTTVTLSDPTVATPTFATPAILADEALVFRLTVDDGLTQGTDEVTINLDLNETPVADAGPALQATINPAGQTVQLDAGGSTDPEGDTLTYAWTQVSGTPVTLSGAATATPTFTVPTGAADGDTAVFEVEVSDGLTSSTAQVTVTYVTNASPVADAGTDLNIVVPPENRTVTLTAAASTDPEGDALTFRWRQVSGPGAPVNLSGVNTATPSFVLPTGVGSGTYEFEVSVSDGNSSSTDRVQVVVVRNDAPTADAGADQAINVPPGGQTVTLDGSASSDPENDTLVYSWVQLAGPTVALSDPNAVSPTFTVPAGVTDADDFRFQLTVTDGRNPDAVDEVFIDIVVDDPPTAVAGADQTLNNPNDGQIVTFDGSASTDPEGQTLTYSWTQTSGRTLPIADASTVTPDVTYTAPVAGNETFTFELVVSDGTSNSVADEVVLTVVNNVAPTADAGVDQGPIDADQTVTLDGTASSDPDGDTLTYDWVQVSGPSVTLSDASIAQPSFTAPDVAANTDLVFELTVSDGSLRATDRVTISVQPVGSVTVITNVQGSDGSFAFTSSLAGLNQTLTTQNGTGSLRADRVRAGTYTLSAPDERQAGYALTAFTCNDSDSTADAANRTASITVAPGENVVCTITYVNSREAASKAIAQQLAVRNRMLLSNQPDISRRLDRVKGTTSSDGSVQVAGLPVPGGSQLPINAQVDGRGNISFDASLLAATNGAGYAGSGKTGEAGSWDVWTEGTFSQFAFNGGDGDFSVLYMGADKLVKPGVLVGGLVQLDRFDLEGTQGVGSVGSGDGKGFMFGPYVTAKVRKNLYLDARVAYGTSANSVDPLGTFSDDYDTTRALFSGSVVGDFDRGPTNIRPEVSLRFINEEQKAYTDSLGVRVDPQSVSLGEVSFAPRVSHDVLLNNGWTLSPYGEVEGIYSFGDEIDRVFGSDARLRLEGGFGLVSEGGVRASLSGFADGLGDGDYSSEGIRLSLSYTMK